MFDTPTLSFDNTFERDMAGFYLPWQGETVPEPSIIRLNRELADQLGLPVDALERDEGAAILAGSVQPEGGSPLAMAYAGHQFGNFSPQLGDGRALLVGELIDRAGHRHDLHLKGSGRTPFSRGGDGKAVLGPVLREYLFGEAMHALGIPTTRALAAVRTGETIMRTGPEPGAVLARIAASHLRVGTFQFFAARGETSKVRQLADYAIARHYPELHGSAEPYLGLFRAVCEAQAGLVAKWMLVGFVHGVMNTDNTTISGETIDYGPCAFIDAYDPGAVYSSIDQQGRYAYGNQPGIVQWNLARFAETLIHLVDPDDPDAAIAQLTDEVNSFAEHYQRHWLVGMRTKLGLTTEAAEDIHLAEALLATAQPHSVDFTTLFRALATLVRGDSGPARALFAEAAAFEGWAADYQRRLATEPVDGEVRADAMDRVNPIYIPRNHLVDGALQAAVAGDLNPFDQLLSVLSTPFTPQSGMDAYAEPAPEGFGPFTTYCGT